MKCVASVTAGFRKLTTILLLMMPLLAVSAAETNYFCVVCGKGPLHGRIWISKWGAVCSDCIKLENHCSICGLPIRDGDTSSVKTGDGRFICKFDKTNAVLDEAEAREVFTDTRRDLIELFGSGFVLKYPDVTVNLFDVDYWSEAGRPDGLHKFGFASTRKTPGGACTHEVVMLSGRLRTELAATAAHEYTHLWINENRPDEHVIDRDTIEAICELSAYKLMQARGQTNQMQHILDNSYTHGEIKHLVALEQERGIGWILNWVKIGTTQKLDIETLAQAAPLRRPTMTVASVPPPLPTSLKLDGLLLDGSNSHAIINGQSFTQEETWPVKLRDRTVLVHCLEIHSDSVVIKVDGKPDSVTLKIEADH